MAGILVWVGMRGNFVIITYREISAVFAHTWMLYR